VIVKEPKYEKWEDIKKKYDGYCIFLTNCKGGTLEPEGGIVRAYNEDMGDLIGETNFAFDWNKEDFGDHSFQPLKEFGDIGVIEVIPYDN